MKNYIMCVLAGFLCFTSVNAQEDSEPKSLYETMYMIPKPGMNKQFEEGVAAHNQKFHASGNDNQSMLRRVEYGNKAGWYVWVMNGTYASLDNRPNDDAHSSDWEDKVGEYVEEYGTVDLWSLNKELSSGMDKFRNQKRYEVWAVYLKPWEGYRFDESMKKIQKAFEKMGNRSMLVFDSEVSRKGGADVGLVWGYDKFADMENDSKLVDTYEEINGKGSWRLFLEEWRDVVEDIDMEHRVKVGDM
ncbi:hypothetical protein ML462_06110 [Gramella lutea]|uniref:Uncharacterized protein n=1 Tax=Christiangramia lutea TaxID=1607951 RepID=A0A9X1V4R7_9FLAO|nr:hypothetical protein [Christiangramia lutea]MCH4822743.1 hypothetical protein [Christiangramia lutea]